MAPLVLPVPLALLEQLALLAHKVQLVLTD
jgi:hypothetical protein